MYAIRSYYAVDGHERLVGAIVAEMNGFGDQLFTGSAFPMDENGAGIAFRHLLHHGKDRLHVLAVADNASWTSAGMFESEVDHFPFQFPRFEGFFDHEGQFVQVEVV